MRAPFAIALAAACVAAPKAADARPLPRNIKHLFEEECLYCHSGAVIEQRRLRGGQWRRVVERMRKRAPLLISAQDAEWITRYLVSELRLVPSDPRPRAPRPAPEEEEPIELVEAPPPAPAPVAPPPQQPPGTPAPVAAPAPAQAAWAAIDVRLPPDAEAEARGPELMAVKCSKCHTLRRVYSKIDSLAIGESVIERMRRKTGSGISPDDAEMLRRFLRSRIARDE